LAEPLQEVDARPVATIPHAGVLEDLLETPGCMLASEARQPLVGHYSCAFCGVGDSSDLSQGTSSSSGETQPVGGGTLCVGEGEDARTFECTAEEDGTLEVLTRTALTPPGGVLSGELRIGDHVHPFVAREVGALHEDGDLRGQRFAPYTRTVSVTQSVMRGKAPTAGCIKLRLSTVRQRPVYPIHAAPSRKTPSGREGLTYQEGIADLASLLLDHRPTASTPARTLVYASGQIDYFTIFAMQEVFRLLGIRSMTGNAEHCLNAGAVHNAILTGQEGPFLTLEQSLEGEDRLFLFNGWNGYVTHPPVFNALLKRPDLDAYLIEVMVTESAKALAQKLGSERILLIRPGSDPHLALAVAGQILRTYPDQIEERFLEHFADKESFERFRELALSPRFEVDRVAERIAPEPGYVGKLARAIPALAHKLAASRSVPINIPSVGLSQTSGVVAHCLWGCTLAMLGKYGLQADGTPAGGTLRVPGQINAESEVQGLSGKYFMGRIPMSDAAEAAARMGLPEDAYALAVEDEVRAALDFSVPTPGVRELFLCFGTQFEANMIGRPRWIEKLKSPGVTLAVVDPIPDPFTLEHAQLVVPSPPHSATPKLYQNGEWRLSLSVPQKRAPRETRSDATILYDVMAEILKRLEQDPEVARAHPDLAAHASSGYLERRFGSGLTRVDGEVSRPQLFERVRDYMSGGRGPLYCRFDHADGSAVRWDELMDQGNLIYGGVGTHRYALDYSQPDQLPYGDVYREPRRFRFFVPTEHDLRLPSGVIFNTGRSTLSDDRGAIRFATSTFNSGKATPAQGMPEETQLFVSPSLARSTGVRSGDWARLTGRQGGEAVFPVVVTDRVKGDSVYASFHRSRAQEKRGLYVNDLTSDVGRCAYSNQTSVKVTPVQLERWQAGDHAPRLDTTQLDPTAALPVWAGESTPLYVTEIVQETHDVSTFRFQGDPLCRFSYLPGQYGTFLLNIDGNTVRRSYSFSSSPTRPFVLEVTVKRVPGGLVSNWLPDVLSVGDRVVMRGPRGHFCLTPGEIPRKLLLLSAGSGVTPMMSMARWLHDVSADVDVLFLNAVRGPLDVIFADELAYLAARSRGFKLILSATRTTEQDAWTGPKGRIDAAMLRELVPDLHERDIYMCGPDGFMEGTRAHLEELGFDRSKLHMESFGSARSQAGAGQVTAQLDGTTRVEFARSGRLVLAAEGANLLDLAEANGIEVDYSCRAGSCGDCKVRVLQGEAAQEFDDGLTATEKEAGYVLACASTVTTHCVLDA
jgi:ferredoxin-NADP reductase/anaerobic selenocysteine-containing dehydrogenase